MNTLKRLTFLCLLLCTAAIAAVAQDAASWAKLEKSVNFYIANDLGRNGYYDQKPIAELMGRMAETVGIECVVAAGDVHHFEGVRSTSDPLWMTNYELIYSHPELMLPWYPILGNHEYRGNTQAVLDYAGISARWEMPARYYTFTVEDNDVTVRVVMLDTTPLIDKYREDTVGYPDACRQEVEPQLSWLDRVLTDAREDWVIVVGHHPIFAQTEKSEKERLDMQRRVDTVLRRHDNVAMYVCGHLHTFQHIRRQGTDIDYVVNSSASLSREVSPIEGTQFCSGATGFSLVAADKDRLCLYMLDKDGKVLHTVSKTR
ncbi:MULTISPECIES: metallophosphoesterase [Mediterranea]|uniref:metallophosphoesterase n=1 Tax=Mediterranea TaxID=1926659 RepID=UPI002011E795|nr:MULTISPECIES: metallophosphoesterase [Mediterranea]MCL1608330.1 metallophosphoesterase [Mediterranea sp. ET5]MDM8123022.1 metallophosphoesterase [Mediterranea massiliensis]MDM8199344.1 metallophosphoesterase [Mediterranea massiliensis]